MSSPSVVVIGIVTVNKDHLSILTLAGDTIILKAQSVLRQIAVSAGEDGEDSIKRVFIERDAEIQVVTQAEAIRGIPTESMTIHKSYDDGGSSAKYYDDGGTISKSRDDLYSNCNI